MYQSKKQTFLWIRLVVLGLCDLIAIISVTLIVIKKLYKFLPLTYILCAELSTICMTTMALCFIINNTIFNPNLDEVNQIWCSVEGYAFRVSQLMTIAFTALVIFAIYKGIKQQSNDLKIKNRRYLIYTLMFPCIIMLPPALTQTYRACKNNGVAYNCLCLEDEYKWWIYLLVCIVPSILICTYMIVFYKKIIKEFKSDDPVASDQKQLSMHISKYPIYNLAIIIMNIIFSSISQIYLKPGNKEEVMQILFYFFNLIVFLLPIPNIFMVYIVYNKLKKYGLKRAALLTSITDIN